MEILVVIAIFIVMAILPFYIMIEINFLGGLAAYAVIEFIFSKLFGGPVISLLLMYTLRIVMYAALIFAALVGIGFIAVTYFNFDFSIIPFFTDFFDFLSGAVTAFGEYV